MFCYPLFGEKKNSKFLKLAAHTSASSFQLCENDRRILNWENFSLNFLPEEKKTSPLECSFALFSPSFLLCFVFFFFLFLKRICHLPSYKNRQRISIYLLCILNTLFVLSPLHFECFVYRFIILENINGTKARTIVAYGIKWNTQNSVFRNVVFILNVFFPNARIHSFLAHLSINVTHNKMFNRTFQRKQAKKIET